MTRLRYRLAVFVKDSATGAPAASGATLVTVDQHTVRKPGFKDWVRSGVQVTADACHVRLTTITALLQR